MEVHLRGVGGAHWALMRHLTREVKVGIASSEYARGVRTTLTRRMKLVPRFLMDSGKSNEHFFRPCLPG